MYNTREPLPADFGQLEYQLDLLSSVDASDAPFLSCYLDARAGEEACQRYLDAQAAQIRHALSGAARMDFEAALEMVRAELADRWHADIRGIAVFARSLAGGHFLSAMTTAVELENRFTFYRVPDLLPLADLVGREAPLTLILARSASGIQVLDLDLGNIAPRAWLALPRRRDEVAETDAAHGQRWGRKRHVAVSAGYDHFARRVLAAQTTRQIVVAGDADAVEQVSGWLPQRVRHHLLDQVIVPAHIETRDAIDYVRQVRQTLYHGRADGMARRLVRALRVNGNAVAGAEASLGMLEAGLLKTLLVCPQTAACAGWHCSACGETGVQADLPGSCPQCGEASLQTWWAPVELVRLAMQHGVRIVVNDSEDLHDLGGVAGLLTETAELQVMPEPALPRRLDLVA
jgi:hypothetical protein